MPRLKKSAAAAAASAEAPPSSSSLSAALGTTTLPSDDANLAGSAPALLAAAPLHPSQFDATVAELRATLHSLQASQQANSELAAKQLAKAGDAKAEAQKALVDTLRNEVRLLTKRLNDEGPVPLSAVRANAAFRQLEAEAAAAKARANALAARVADLEAAAKALPPSSVVRALHLLSGISMAPAAPSTMSSASHNGLFVCSAVDPETAQALRFTLDLYDDEEEGGLWMAYDPFPTAASTSPSFSSSSVAGTAGVSASECERLPAFLRESMCFAADQAPMFLAKLTEALREEQQPATDAPSSAGKTAAVAVDVVDAAPELKLGAGVEAESTSSACQSSAAGAAALDTAAAAPLPAATPQRAHSTSLLFADTNTTAAAGAPLDGSTPVALPFPSPSPASSSTTAAALPTTAAALAAPSARRLSSITASGFAFSSSPSNSSSSSSAATSAMSTGMGVGGGGGRRRGARKSLLASATAALAAAAAAESEGAAAAAASMHVE